jgi:transposase
VVFVDETGCMLQPLVRRTWAPRGRTPMLYSWDRHDRLSVIGALTLAPRRRRLGLYFRIHSQNIHAEHEANFVAGVYRALRRPLLVVWDRWSVHRKAARMLQEHFGKAITFEWLPPYAPDLNPMEGVWGHTKYADLANFIPEDIDHLHTEVLGSLQQQRSTPALLASFLRHAGLTL